MVYWVIILTLTEYKFENYAALIESIGLKAFSATLCGNVRISELSWTKSFLLCVLESFRLHQHLMMKAKVISETLSTGPLSH